MGLKAVVDAEAFEALDEGVRGFYTEASDGRYVLDAEGVDDLPQVQGLKSTLEKFKKVDPDAGRLKRRLDGLSKWEDFDGDPDSVREALARLEEMESGGKKKGDDDDALKTTYQNKLRAAQEKHEAEVQERDQFIEKLLIDNRLDAELAKVAETGVLPDTKKAVKALLRTDHNFKVIREGNEYRAVVDTDMGEQDIETFLDSWGRSDEAKPFLPASGNKGSGAKGGTGTGGGRENPWATGNLTEQGRIIRDNPTLAKTLAMQAGKKPPRIAA